MFGGSRKNNPEFEKAVNEARKKISLDEYKVFAQKSALEKLQEELAVADDVDVRTAIEQQILLYRQIEEIERAKLEEDAKKKSDLAERAKRVALARGPLLRQRIAAKFGFVNNVARRAVSWMRSTLWAIVDIVESIGVIWRDYPYVLLSIVTAAILAQAGIYAVAFALDINFVIESLILLASFCLYYLTIDPCTDTDRRLRNTRFFTVAMILFFFLNQWASFVGGTGMIGVVTRGDEVVRIVDTEEEVFMKPPSIWSGEKVTWYSLSDGTENRSARIKSESLSNGLNGVIIGGVGEHGLAMPRGSVIVSIVERYNAEGLKKMWKARRDIGELHAKIRQEERAIVNEACKLAGERLIDKDLILGTMAERLKTLSNDVFEVESVKVTVTHDVQPLVIEKK